jgi:hypothetical protein
MRDRGHLAVLALFAAFAVVETFPLVLNFGTRMVGIPGDGFQTLWHFWLVSRWRETGATPFATSLIFWPTGTTLWTHMSNVLNALWTWPILEFFGPVAAYNTAALVNLVLNAFGAYLLAWRLEAKRAPAVLAGLAFGFCAYFSAHLLGHLVLLSAGFIPLGILWTLEALDTGRPSRTLLAGLALALNLVTLAHVFFIGLFMALAFPWLLLRREDPGVSRAVLCRRMLAIGSIAIVLALPFALGLRRELAATEGVEVPRAIQRQYSADLLSFITPSALHPVLGPLVRPWVEAQMGRPPAVVEGLVSTGLTVLALGLIGLVSVRVPRGRSWPLAEKLGPLFWGLVALVSIVLALGPKLKYGGHQTRFLLPFAALASVTGLRALSAPGRFAVLAQLALAILAARGLARLTAGSSPTRTRVISASAIALVGFESLWLPYPNTSLPAPSAFHERLGREDGGGAVLDVPFTTYDPLPMVDQMTHGRPILNGYVSRFPVDCVGCLYPAPLSAFHPGPPRPDILPEVDLAAAGAPLLRSFGVEYVIVHRDRLDIAQVERARAAIGAMNLGPPVYSDDRLDAYRVPAAVDAMPFVTMALFHGVNFATSEWSNLEVGGPEPTRMIARSATRARMLLWATRSTSAELRFVAGKPRPAEVVRLCLNEEACLEEPPGSDALNLVIPLRLRRGANRLAIEGATSVGAMSLLITAGSVAAAP